MPNPVVHVEIRGLEQPQLRSFYEDIFGWRPDEDLSVDGYSIVPLGETPLTAATGAVPDWSTRSCTFYIQVDDIDETLRRIEAQGGRPVMPRTASPDSFPATHIRVFTKFVDPAGNVVGLVEKPR